MTRLSLVALLLAGGAAASDLLYVTAYENNITTLNMGKTEPAAGGKYPAMKAVTITSGCGMQPSMLTLNHAAGQLFCMNEYWADPDVKGTLTAYKKSADGVLTQLGVVDTAGSPVSGSFFGCKGHGFALAHYGGAAFSTVDISDPAKMKVVDTLRYNGPNGTVLPQQAKPHPHQAVVDPTGKYIVVPDLGSDVIHLYSFDPKTLKPTELPALAVEKGSGPRHVAFAVRGPKTFMYLVTELSNKIIGYEVTYDKTIQLKQTFAASVPADGKKGPEPMAASEIVVSPDQKFVIVSARRVNGTQIPSFEDKSKMIDSDPLINYSIDETTGKLTLKQSVPAGGFYPRHFSINKAGTKLAVALQLDSRVVVIKRDPKSGDLGDFESFASLPGQISSVIFDE